MKILFLSQVIPYPPHGGVLQRGYNIIREISRSNDVHLLAFCHPDILETQDAVEESREELGRFCSAVDYFSLWPKKSPVHKSAALLAGTLYPKPFSFLAHRSSKFRQRIDELVGKGDIDVVHLDTIGLMPYWKSVSRLPTILTHHNIESSLMKRRASVESNVFNRFYVNRQAKLLKKHERIESRNVDINVVVSGEDKKALLQLCPDADVEVVPNGVDIEYFTPSKREPECAVIYTGGMNMFANEDAVLHFIRRIWPSVRQALPDAKFYVIGQDPPGELLSIAEKDVSIVVTGYVDDVRPYVEKAAVYVVPIRVGGGTRLKVLDAMAQGKAIVSTSVGCEGINVVDGQNICIEDADEQFAQRTVELLKDGDSRRRLGNAAREVAVQEYSWLYSGRKLQAAYTRIAGDKADT